MARHLGVEDVSGDALPVLEVVGGEVLAAGGGLEVGGVDGAGDAVALHAADEDGGVLAGHRRVLAGGLLAPAPPRVPEHVDVGRPEGEPLRLPVVVHRPSLHADHLQATPAAAAARTSSDSAMEFCTFSRGQFYHHQPPLKKKHKKNQFVLGSSHLPEV